MAPRVSVIMSVYNGEAFIGQALNSALSQDYLSLEVVVSDDGSTDRTPEIVRGFVDRHPERLVSVRAERNQGKPFGLNRGLAAASGQYIAWLDSDDVMLPGKLKKQVDELERHPDAAGCVHDAEIFESDSERVIGRFSRVVNGRPMRSGGVELWVDPTYKMLPSATMIRASARPEAGFDERISFANDWLFDLQTFCRGPCIALDEVLVRYRRHAHNFTTQAQSQGIDFEESLMAVGVVEARRPELERHMRAFRAALLLGEARRRARAGESRPAVRYALAAARAGGLAGNARVARYVTRAGLERRRLN
jgi:glycosyltransferase involved in cell wall biosynthesis